MFYKTWQRMARCAYCRRKHRYLESRCVTLAEQFRFYGEPLKLTASLCPDCYRSHVLGKKPKRTKPHEFLRELPLVAEEQDVPRHEGSRVARRFAAKGWKVVPARRRSVHHD